jgi:hypothetical protein
LGEPVQSLAPHYPHRMRCSHRDPEDNFFCNRYQVWYPSFDCAVRTKFRTSDGCRDCEQGRFNLKRHSADLCSPTFRLRLST